MQQALTLIERDFPGARCFCTAKFTTSKLSVHVILPNYKADFEGRCKLKMLALTDEYAKLGFDASIYSIAVRFKGPNQSKGDGRVMRTHVTYQRLLTWRYHYTNRSISRKLVGRYRGKRD